MSIWHQLDRPLDVWREVLAADGSGGRNRVWAFVGTVYAMVSQPRAAQRVAAQQAGSRHDHVVHLDPDDDVRRRDRLRDHAADPSTVKPEQRPYFDVMSVVRPSKGDVYLRAECELIQPEAEPWPAR
jgi:head-tail adaptor